jgi:hypothetical protein
MNLNAFRDEARAFLKTVDPLSDEPISKIIRMIDEEHRELKASLDDPKRLGHQIYDLLFLLFELAAKENVDLDTQWLQGRDRKLKYMEQQDGRRYESANKANSADAKSRAAD